MVCTCLLDTPITPGERVSTPKAAIFFSPNQVATAAEMPGPLGQSASL